MSSVSHKHSDFDFNSAEAEHVFDTRIQLKFDTNTTKEIENSMKCIDKLSSECFYWKERDCRKIGDDISWESSYDQCMVKNFISRYDVKDADEEVPTQYCKYAFGNYSGIVG